VSAVKPAISPASCSRSSRARTVARLTLSRAARSEIGARPSRRSSATSRWSRSSILSQSPADFHNSLCDLDINPIEVTTERTDILPAKEQDMSRISLLGAPVDSGQRRRGCLMGPAAYRIAGIETVLRDLGHSVSDAGDATPQPLPPAACANPAIDQLDETLGWTAALRARVAELLDSGEMPVVLGGDHSLALGSVAGAAEHAARAGRPLFLLWLDAHSDFHTPLTTVSGNLHGTPVAYIAGRAGFDAFPAFPAPLPEENICLFGIRSVDAAESAALRETEIVVDDMRVLDERGVVAPLR